MLNFLKFLMRSRSNQVNIAVLVLCPILQYAMLHWMAKSRIIEHVMTMNCIPDAFSACAIIIFLVLRATTYVVIPGFFVSWLIFQSIEFRKAGNR